MSTETRDLSPVQSSSRDELRERLAAELPESVEESEMLLAKIGALETFNTTLTAWQMGRVLEHILQLSGKRGSRTEIIKEVSERNNISESQLYVRRAAYLAFPEPDMVLDLCMHGIRLTHLEHMKKLPEAEREKMAERLLNGTLDPQAVPIEVAGYLNPSGAATESPPSPPEEVGEADNEEEESETKTNPHVKGIQDALSYVNSMSADRREALLGLPKAIIAMSREDFPEELAKEAGGYAVDLVRLLANEVNDMLVLIWNLREYWDIPAPQFVKRSEQCMWEPDIPDEEQ